MSRQLSILLMSFLVMACQPDHRNSHKKDPIHQFLEAEVVKLDKSLGELDKALEELDKPDQADDISLLTMKVAAHRRTLSLIGKERSRLEQERAFLQMQLRSRAHSVIFRSMRGDLLDKDAEFASFKARYRSRMPASE